LSTIFVSVKNKKKSQIGLKVILFEGGGKYEGTGTVSMRGLTDITHSLFFLREKGTSTKEKIFSSNLFYLNQRGNVIVMKLKAV
jgi:hypothetical protein